MHCNYLISAALFLDFATCGPGILSLAVIEVRRAIAWYDQGDRRSSAASILVYKALPYRGGGERTMDSMIYARVAVLLKTERHDVS